MKTSRARLQNVMFLVICIIFLSFFGQAIAENDHAVDKKWTYVYPSNTANNFSGWSGSAFGVSMEVFSDESSGPVVEMNIGSYIKRIWEYNITHYTKGTIYFMFIFLCLVIVMCRLLALYIEKDEAGIDSEEVDEAEADIKARIVRIDLEGEYPIAIFSNKSKKDIIDLCGEDDTTVEGEICFEHGDEREEGYVYLEAYCKIFLSDDNNNHLCIESKLFKCINIFNMKDIWIDLDNGIRIDVLT